MRAAEQADLTSLAVLESRATRAYREQHESS
jgi:hypothetical protein